MVFNNFLNAEELRRIFAIYPKWKRGGTIKNPHARVVDTYDITHKFDWLDKKVASFVKERNKGFRYNITSIEETKLLRYKPGGKYDWHQDVIWDNPQHRKFTYIIQLSPADTYKGGNFQFRDADNIDLSTLRGQGSIIVFPSIMHHRITPLTEGTRYSIVGWVVGPQWT